VSFPVVTRLVDPPLYVVTADDGTERSGCLVGFATQCSIHPPRFLVCLSVLNHTERVARRTGALGIHLLDAEDHPLAAHFGGLTGDEADKFAGVAWHRGVSAPRLHGPYVQWSYSYRGKRVNRWLTAEQADRLRDQVERGRRIKELTAELDAAEIRRAERAEGWGT
jgi:Flavin reductase like domain